MGAPVVDPAPPPLAPPPGLMYGGGGASGGGSGSTTGAPMGVTGAAGAGSAADPNAQLQALMSLRQVRMSERKNEAEINLLNTQADALKAEEIGRASCRERV